MKINVLGLGYIGLPTALLLARSGHQVIGVDIDEKKIDILNKGKLPFNEPGLEELYDNAKDNFEAKEEPEEGDVFIIAVPTPLDRTINVADLNAVINATEMIYPVMKKDNLVILESTVPPGTSENLVLPILKKSGLEEDEFFLVHSPERAIPGETLKEMIENDRVIGGLTTEGANKAKEVYSSFSEGHIFITDIKMAEMVKLMENTFRDVNIALANEFSRIAEDIGIDVWKTIDLANNHPRVDILRPGPGVGGHCIAVDPLFLTANSTTGKMINLAREINDSMPNFVLSLIRKKTDGIDHPIISIFGVAYKGNVDDTRETPAKKIIRLALNEGYQVRCYDPHVQEFDHELFDLDDSVKNSDCILIVTDHDEFKDIDPKRLKMNNKNIIDTRNIIDREKWEDAGFEVKIMGTDNHGNSGF
ncbi:MAG: nucleotide sugar dehydrogenase [Thermoplasmatota archaeon]